MVRSLLISILLISILFTSGCWGRREIENLAIISAVGIDRVEVLGQKKWQLTFEIFRPQTLGASGEQGGGAGEVSPAWIVTSLGDTLEEAVNNFSSRTPRVLFFEHNRMIVIGEDTVREKNLADILSLAFRSEEVRLRTWLLIAEGQAKEVLTAGWELEEDISSELIGMIENTKYRLSKAEVCNLKDVGEALATPGKDVIAGRIGIFPTPEPTAKGPGSGQGNAKTSVRLQGASVFSNGNFAGWFDDMETRGYLLIVGKAKSSVLSLRLGKGDEVNASVRIIKASSRITPEIVDGMPRIKVHIEVEGHLDEYSPGEFAVNSELMEHVGEKVAFDLKTDAELAVAKAQEYRADVFGFGQAFYRKYPRYWRQVEDQWRDYFINLPVEITVDVVIRRAGMFLEPIRPR